MGQNFDDYPGFQQTPGISSDIIYEIVVKEIQIVHIIKNIKYFRRKLIVVKEKQKKKLLLECYLGWFKTPVSSQTHKLMAATKFSDYLGLKDYKKAKK
jgi:hypothetical protein